MNLTQEQISAIESAGRTIVSASAGSGKTFVMIQKLVSAIQNGVDLDNVLAVTFTKKAASQMKDKLRAAIIDAMESADEQKRSLLKVQLSKISSASISTIHSFCAKLLRTYFYVVGIDGTFDIISSDDAEAKEYMADAVDGMFERYYEEGNEDFIRLLKFYRKKRSDNALKNLIVSSYEKLRITADYKEVINKVNDLYTEEGFTKICEVLKAREAEKFIKLRGKVEEFTRSFVCPKKEYFDILGEMYDALDTAARAGLFEPLPSISQTRKPRDITDEEKLAGATFKEFRDNLNCEYKKVRGDIADEQTERKSFFESGLTAKAFMNVLMEFDRQYTEIKRSENKLDYNDLEHLTLELLKDESVRAEINAGFSCVFVDEYQDVNPVQEQIITRVGGQNVFLVGDVKQAIYGFRGSKSLFFAQKFNRLEEGEGQALRLSSNFRSSDGVLDFVNDVFSNLMTTENCGFDYAPSSIMKRGGGYPEGFGSTEIHIFGVDDGQKEEPDVYSVRESGREVKHSREGLAVLEIVKRELKNKHFDLKSGEYVDTQSGDICILTRKRNKNYEGIVRALTDAGYSVSGAREEDITGCSEVKQMLDILSYIDNEKQDIPLSTALLSPLGGLTCDELSAIRIAAKKSYGLTFGECCDKYASRFGGEISKKLENFYYAAQRLRELAEVLSADKIIDKILEDTGLEAVYSAGGGQKLKNVRRLAAEGAGISVSKLLAKIKGGYQIPSPAPALSDSIKIMTMHASKGLEFPVVIIADICALFKGRDTFDMPFDEEYGFAPRFFDEDNMTYRTTLVRNLISRKTAQEELKNEMNLFYVACTRAMCRLHIMAQEINDFDVGGVGSAGTYAELLDISKYSPEIMPPVLEDKKEDKQNLVQSADENLKKSIEERLMREYAFANSVNLPVKSSASALLHMYADEEYYRSNQLFQGEEETGTERGIAYHRFLELCDFSIKDRAGICAELDNFLNSGRISAGQFEILNPDNLVEIINMPVFDGLAGAVLYREREFLCKLPANVLMQTDADDDVLIQGAIDLLALAKDGCRIIDYKYSKKSDEQLVHTYSRQLELYKKAVALILHIDENSIQTAIVNINLKRLIKL
ncbi:MAG: UvrD-helicase domain-containing protein [Clostridia bacterium]|nr:UvrD-helicase domain-containing protein [Clostridia bacterium]